MDLIGVLASLASHSQTCPTSPTRQTPHKLVDLLTCWLVDLLSSLMGSESEEAGADGPNVDCPQKEESVGNHIVNGAPWRWEGDEEVEHPEH